MMGERRVMQEALFFTASASSGTSRTIICCARSTVLWTFRRSGGIWSLITARRVVLRSIPS